MYFFYFSLKSKLWEALVTVTVLIKREVAPGSEILLEELYREVRKIVLTQESYIGDETFKRIDMDRVFLIISKWQPVDNGSKWLVSKERMVFQERTDNLGNGQTKFEIYTH